MNHVNLKTDQLRKRQTIKNAIPLLIFLLLFIAATITSCQKQSYNSDIIKVVTPPQTNPLQPLVDALKKRIDSLANGLTQSNSTILTLKANISTSGTTQGNPKINIDSIKTQIGEILTHFAALNTNVTGAYSQVSVLNSQISSTSANTATITAQIDQQNTQVTQLSQQYASLLSQVQQTEMVVEPILGPKSYIAIASTANVRYDEGDVIACPDYYLVAYTKFGASTSDIAGTTIVGKMSTDTTGKIWGNEFVISANIGQLNVMSVSLYRVGPSTIKCYFLVKNSTADTRLFSSTSFNNGLTWSAATQVIDDNAYDIFINSSIIKVNNGRLVIPVASVPVFSAGFTFSDFCYYSDNGGSSWTKSSAITPPVTRGGLEPEIVQISGDMALMNIRTSTGFQYFSLSTDNCKTWGAPYQSTLISPSSPAKIVNISGVLYAIHNNSSSYRIPLSISKSSDKGATWTHLVDIDDGNRNIYGYSYPSVTVSNGYLLISYYETVNEPAPVSAQYYNLKFTKIAISSL
jgi:hypothetical protein